MAINPNCTVIAVIGGKGGVGKSVFAANFACALMSELRAQTLLIDADSKSVGDQNVITGMKPVKTLRELSAMQGSLSSLPLNQLVTVHPSGLSFIGAVRGPEERLEVRPDLVVSMLESMSRQFKFIVVDLGNDIGPLQSAILMESTAGMIVTTPEVLVVTQTQRLMNDLLSATFPKDMFQLVINKASATGLNPTMVSNQLQMPAMGVIPMDEATAMGSLAKFMPLVLAAPKAPITQSYYDLVRKLTGGTLQRLKSLSKPKPSAAAIDATKSAGSNSAVATNSISSAALDPRTQLKLRVHSELIRTADINKLLQETKGDESKQAELREKTKREITQIVDREAPDQQREERSKIIVEVLQESLGLGPLEDLLADPNISEIMVNGAKKIFVEKNGKIVRVETTFTSNDHLRRIIERIVTPLGRQISTSVPYVDARLKDGSRVNAVIEPLSIDGPAVTIRKFKKGGVTPEKYIEYGSMNKNMIDFMRICVENGVNIVISGGTGSGKTTLLNMLSSFIPRNERIITVEDAAELQLQQDHVVRLETRPPSMEGTNAIHIRDLIKNALRMRPDRIVVGECRDGAALDMLQAMNTGHDGSMTTTHANTPRECLARLETLVMMAGMDLPAKVIREQIASAVQMIIQISRLSDGSRRIMSITEVTGMQGETVSAAEIFKFKEVSIGKNREIIGEFQWGGTIPKIIEKLAAKGVTVSREIFSNDGPKPAAVAAPASGVNTTGKPPIPTNPVKKTG